MTNRPKTTTAVVATFYVEVSQTQGQRSRKEKNIQINKEKNDIKTTKNLENPTILRLRDNVCDKYIQLNGTVATWNDETEHYTFLASCELMRYLFLGNSQIFCLDRLI